MCASAPRSMKEEGGNSSRPVLAVGGGFRPGALGRGLLGSSAVWAFARKGVVSARPIGWTSPRPCSHSASGLSRGKTGAGQARYPPEEDRRGATGPKVPRITPPTPAPQGCHTPGASGSQWAPAGSLGVAVAFLPSGQHSWEETQAVPPGCPGAAWSLRPLWGGVIQSDPFHLTGRLKREGKAPPQASY